MERPLAKRTFVITTVAILTFTLFYSFYASSLIFLSALTGIGMAALAAPAVKWLERNWKIPRFFGTLLILFFVTGIFLSLFVLMGSIVVEQVESLRESWPSIVETWSKKWDVLVKKYPKMTKNLEENQTADLAKTMLPMIGVALQSFISFLTGISLALVIALFTSANSDGYFQGFLKFFPKSSRQEISEDLEMSGQVLRKWFVAQLIDMGAVAVLTAIGLWIVGIEYWVIYGLMAGLLSIVPYAGTLIVVFFSGGIVLAQQPDKFFYLILVFIITQQLEGNFILPKVMKDQVKIPAAPLIFFMILVGSWFGPLGVFVTPPLTAIGVCFFHKYKNI